MAIQKTSYADDIYQQLRDEILTGAMRPGDRVAETEIAQRMGTSQGPVREAFTRLREQGLLISFRHRGSYVSEISESEARQAYAVRGVIEPIAIQAALPHIGDAEIGLLEEQIRKMEAAAIAGDVAADLANDMQFHRYLFQWSGSTTLLQCWNVVETQILKFAIVASPPIFTDLTVPARSHYPLLEHVKKGWSAAFARDLDQHLKVIWTPEEDTPATPARSRRARANSTS
jgi:DNA-binding GntR family transcriptional regulator